MHFGMAFHLSSISISIPNPNEHGVGCDLYSYFTGKMASFWRLNDSMNIYLTRSFSKLMNIISNGGSLGDTQSRPHCKRRINELSCTYLNYAQFMVVVIIMVWWKLSKA